MTSKPESPRYPIPEIPTPFEERLQAFREIFPDCLSEGKIDFDRLRELLGEEVDSKPEKYSFTWAGKRDAMSMVAAKPQGTLIPAPEESIDWESTRNIFIEGENLAVLKLLYKSYFGRVKMIYIDPPYNTGKDFIYPDNFADPLDAYLKLTGQKDGNGNVLTSNPETNGRYHSAWLSMMYPRLFISRQLLDEDGTIFISIDNNELQNLKILMNEIFGEESFIAEFIWKSRRNKDNRNITGVSIDHEYVLCYGKKVRGDERKLEQYSNPDNDPRGDWASGNMVGILPQELRPNCHFDLINPKTIINYGKPPLGWRYDRKTMNRLILEDRIIWPKTKAGRPRRKVFLNELQREFTGFSSIIGESVFTADGTNEINDIFGYRAIDFPKPTALLKEILLQGTEKDSIVIDFFSGSSSTADAMYALNLSDEGNRKFVLIQLPEPVTGESSLKYSLLHHERLDSKMAKLLSYS